jgi:hypothetical protein
MSMENSPVTGRPRFRPGFAWAFVFVWVAGAALRLFGAWCARHVTDYDCSVVGLMARHIADGTSLPVFFYGQAYMGTLEPMVSAFLFRLFGESGFALTAGTALVAALGLWAAMRWAADAAGAPAGLVAGLLLWTGPEVFYGFQFAPRGGYMTTLAFGVLVLWLGARLAEDVRAGRAPPGVRYFLVGLFGGLGWWSSQMVTSALLVCALQVAVAARFRVRRVKPVPALAGFLAGSLPFWVWNALNEWASFGMSDNLFTVPMGKGLRLLAVRYRMFVGAWPAFSWTSAVVWGFYLLGLGVGLAVLARALRRRAESPRAAALLTAAAGHLGLSLLFYLTSRQVEMNTARFLVPMWPSAVVLAVAATPLLVRRRGGAAAGGAAVLLVVAAQAVVVPKYVARLDRIEEGRAEDRAFAAWLAGARIEAIYAHYQEYPLNFRVGEQPPFTDLRMERHRPFALAAERARAIGVIGDHGGIRSFVAHTGAGFQLDHIGRWGVIHGFTPPAGALEEIPPDAWAACEDDAGRDLRPALADRHADTVWKETAPAAEASQVIVRLDEPRAVRELRIWPPDDAAFPRALQVEVLDAEGGAWRMVHEALPASHFYWSGPRPYFGGRRAFWACRLPDDPVVRAVRLTRPPTDRRDLTWRIMELQLFAPAEGPAAVYEPAAMAELWELLRERGHRRLYADRWLSTRAHEAMEGRVAVELYPRVFPEGGGLPPGAVTLDAATALAVEMEDLPLTRALLETAGYLPRERRVGPWILLDFDPDVFPDGRPVAPGLWWSGRHLWRADPPPAPEAVAP